MTHSGGSGAPSWKMNLVIVGSLILIMLGYYYYQAREAERSFAAHAEGYARMIAEAAEINASNSVLTQQIVEEMLHTFLGASARFVEYLETVEPFSTDELTAFAEQAGLTGIRIVRDQDSAEGNTTDGPPNWIEESDPCHASHYGLTRSEKEGVYLLTVPKTSGSGCVMVGFSDSRIEELRRQGSLQTLLANLSKLPGVRYARSVGGDGAETLSSPDVVIRSDDSGPGKIAEIRIPLEKEILILGVQARELFDRINRLWYEFTIFSLFAVLLCGGFSFILYQYQKNYLDAMRRFERRLAREQEDASLGRAVGSIAHEIRNPLNAVGIGLQRLQMEADELNEERRAMVSAILQAVRRADGVVSELRRFAGPLTPRFQEIDLAERLAHVADLYRETGKVQGVEVRFSHPRSEPVSADPVLLEEVFENLIKNAVEAQPHGGAVNIAVVRGESEIRTIIENKGFHLPPNQVNKIVEPYFTTKTRGSGLGLSIARRIIQAHGGRLMLEVPEPETIRASVILPISAPEDLHAHSDC